MTGLSVVWRQVEHCGCCCVRKVKPLTDIVPCVYMFCDTAVLILGADRIQSDHCEVVHFSGSNMDFRVMTVVTILALATIMQSQKLERDKATCTASVATKGETAVVTCHYPLVVKQPGEIVSVSMERYPFTSSNTGSPRYGYVLECTWHETFTCTLNKEEHRVEGKDVVITIRNVTEDSQGHYLCKMMVKDGPNIHGEACELRLSGEIPPGPWPRTTDPAMDQPIIRDNDTGSDRGLGAGSVAAIVVCGSVLVVMVTAVFVCRKRKRRRNRPASKPVDETVESGNGLLLQRDHAHPARSGALGQGNNDDIDQSQDISNRPENKVPKLVNLYNERDGARQRDCVSTYRVRLQDTSDCPKDKVRNLANVYNEKEARQQGSVSTSPVRVSKETKETEKTHGKEKKEDEENETGGRQESKQDEEKEKEGEENETEERQVSKQEEEKEKEGEENETEERQESKQDEKEKEGEENETEERQEEKQDEEEKESEENETEERQEEKPNEDEKEDEENKTEEKKQDEEKKDEENEKYREDDGEENKRNEEEEVEDAEEREGGGAESLPLLGDYYRHSS